MHTPCTEMPPLNMYATCTVAPGPTVAYKPNILLRSETSIDAGADLEAFLPKKHTLVKDSSICSEPDFHSHWLPDGSCEPDHFVLNNSSHADIMAAIRQVHAEQAEEERMKQDEGIRAEVIKAEVIKAEPASPPCTPESDTEHETEEVGRKRKRKNVAKENKEIQDIAREGQKHWGEKVKAMRQEWADRNMFDKGEQFSEQFRMCKRLKIKNQNECLLHQLQFSLVDGLVRDVEYGGEDESFVGWKSFYVNSNPTSSAHFRQRIRGMFGSTPSEKTLNNTLRRAGIVPQGADASSPTSGGNVRKNHDWKSAWAGIVRFVYDHNQREKGKGATPAAAE